MVVEDFRTGPARPGVAHLPEIVRARDADNAGLRQTRDLLPKIKSLVVVDIDGRGELVLRQPEFLGDEIPGELDGAVLEIIAEREIAEHLEKGVMPRGVADIVEIVVLAAGAHAFLRGGGALVGPLLDAGEDVLELHHAGIGEHQCRVVARHQRRRRHDLVAVGREKIQKCRPDFVNATHNSPIAPNIASANGAVCSTAAAPLLDKGDGGVQKVCRESAACRTSTGTVDRLPCRVDRLGAAVFSSYLFKTVTSGETGLSAGAEGATAPETLRQTDRVTG